MSKSIDLPEPHTSEWFEAMTRINPQQAAMTSMAVEVAGTPDVCTVCGDEDSEVYIADDPHMKLRLCDDCHRMQEMQGLRVGLAEPLP
jgi:hypothetical protein